MNRAYREGLSGSPNMPQLTTTQNGANPVNTMIATRPTTIGPATPTVQAATSKRSVDPAQRRAEIVIASLFLLTAATSMFAAFALEPLLDAPDYLARIFPNRATVALDALLWSLTTGTIFIAVFAFPLLRRLDEALALGYLVSRIVETTIMLVGVVATLLLIPLSQQFLEAGAPQSSWFQTLGDVLKQTKLLGLTLVSLPLLGLGGLFFTSLLFRFRLVPRFISVVGLIGYGLLIPAGIASWFGLVDPSPSGNVPFLAIPVASFEIILLPFWLLFKGFKMPEARTLSVPPSPSI